MAGAWCPWCMTQRSCRSPLAPSDRHAEAEAAFADVVAKEVGRYLYEQNPCDTVQALDGLVQRGAVRRQAAGVIASTLYPVPGSTTACLNNLLACVLQGLRHKTRDCTCLETVLSWECCPTLVRLRPRCTEATTAISVAIRKSHVLSLLRWGSLPWPICGMKPKAGSLAVPTIFDWMVAVPEVWAAQGQWPRWHWRRCKRQWVAFLALVSHAMPTFEE